MNDPGDKNKNKHLQFRDALKKAITADFVNYVRPHCVLHIFPQISSDVLTDADTHKIKAVLKSDGELMAAHEMLDCLVVYNNWFECIVRLMQHRDVKLGHVAERLIDTHKEVYQKIHSEVTIDVTPPLVIKNDVEWKSKESEGEDSLDTFTLAGNDKKGLKNDGPKPSAPDGASAMQSDLDAYEEIDGPETKVVESKVPNKNQNRPLPKPPSPPPILAPHKELLEKPSHRPQYDFTQIETSEALKTMQGWHEHISERKVEEKLRNVCYEDGHFILWYWERKRRPAMCTTFKNKIKTFIVHKRPAKTSSSKDVIRYYVERHGKYDTDLQAIVAHHLQEGLTEVSSGEMIVFKFPVLVPCKD